MTEPGEHFVQTAFCYLPQVATLRRFTSVNSHAVEDVDSELYFYEADLTALCSSAQRVGKLTRQ